MSGTSRRRLSPEQVPRHRADHLARARAVVLRPPGARSPGKRSVSAQLPRHDRPPAVALAGEGEDRVGPGVDPRRHPGEVDAQEREARVRHRVDQAPHQVRGGPASARSTRPGTARSARPGSSAEPAGHEVAVQAGAVDDDVRREVAAGACATTLGRRDAGRRRRPRTRGARPAPAACRRRTRAGAHRAVVDDAGARARAAPRRRATCGSCSRASRRRASATVSAVGQCRARAGGAGPAARPRWWPTTSLPQISWAMPSSSAKRTIDRRRPGTSGP